MKNALRGFLISAAALLGVALPAFAQTQTGLGVKDGSGASQTLCAYTVGGQLTNCSVKYVWTGSAWALEPADNAGRPIVNVNSLPALPAGSNAIGSVSVSNLPTTQTVGGTVAVSNLPATQPVSAAALPLPTGAATAAGQPALNGDGGALAHVTNFPATQPVSAASLPLPSGAATSAAQTAVQSAPGTSATTAVTVQGSVSGAALPVSLASAPLPTGAATAANQTGGSQKSQIVDGSGNVIGSTANALNVNCSSGCSGGGGSVTQGAGSASNPWYFQGVSGGVPVNSNLDSVVDGQTVTNSVSSAAVISTISTSGFSSASVEIASAGSGNNIVWEVSNDNTNWFSYVSTSNQSNSGSVGVYYFPISTAYFRVRVATYSSGTVTTSVALKRAGGANINTNVPVTVAAGLNVNASSGFTESTTSLGSSATFTASGHTNNSNAYSYFNACAYADQTGTLQVQQSLDSGSTYQTISTASVAANAGQCIHEPLAGSFSSSVLYRLQYVNGSSAQGTFRASTAFTAN